MEIKRKISPYNFTKIYSKENKFIVIHYVGAVSTAKNNADYFYNNKLSSSAHYFVDENEVWQSVEDYNASWHCGGGIQGKNGHTYHGICKNSNSIGIEMCCKKKNNEWYFEEQTVLNTVKLVRHLMKKYNIPTENVIRHFDVTGKICPEPLTDNIKWQEFKNKITDIEDFSIAENIVRELAHRGIVTDIYGMINEINEKPNGRLYWLARKCLNYILTNKIT